MSVNQKVYIAGIKSSNIWEEHIDHGDVGLSEEPEEQNADAYGPILALINAHRPSRSRKKTNHYRPIPFGCCCFAPSSSNRMKDANQSSLSTGISQLEEALNGTLILAAADQLGFLLIFDFRANRVWQVARIGIAISAIAFTPLARNELVVAFTDNTLKCYNIETRQLIAEMRSHRRPIESISMHPREHLTITSSQYEAILWNMEDWTKQKVLHRVKEGASLRHALFSPSGDYIVVIFFDETACIWRDSDFNLVWKIQMPSYFLDSEIALGPAIKQDPACRVLTISQNERAIIMGSKKIIRVWDFAACKLLKEISLQGFAKGEITRLEFIHNDADLLVLTSDGRLLLVDIFQIEPEFHLLNVESPVKLFEVSPDRKFVITNAFDERETLKIWDLEVLISDALQHKYQDYPSKNAPQPVQFSQPSIENLAPPQISQVNKIGSNDSPPPEESEEARRKSQDVGNFQDMTSATYEERRMKLIEKLHKCGNYSDKHRVRIWRLLLNLPDNQQAYKNLLGDNGPDRTINAFILKNFPISDSRAQQIITKFERFLSALINWGFSIELTQTWLATVIYPFVESLVEADDILGFEVILTVLLNWYQHCWQEFPNPPSNYLSIFTRLIEHWDPSLHNHFENCGVNLGKDCLWPILLTSFSSIFIKDDWSQIWDHLLSNEEPSFLHYFTVALVLGMRDDILQISKKKKIKNYFHSMQLQNTAQVIELAYQLEQDKGISPSLSPKFEINQFKPLSKTGRYQLSFGEENLPRFKSQRDDIRDWILEQELEIVKKKFAEVKH